MERQGPDGRPGTGRRECGHRRGARRREAHPLLERAGRDDDLLHVLEARRGYHQHGQARRGQSLLRRLGQQEFHHRQARGAGRRDRHEEAGQGHARLLRFPERAAPAIQTDPDLYAHLSERRQRQEDQECDLPHRRRHGHQPGHGRRLCERPRPEPAENQEHRHPVLQPERRFHRRFRTRTTISSAIPPPAAAPSRRARCPGRGISPRTRTARRNIPR